MKKTIPFSPFTVTIPLFSPVLPSNVHFFDAYGVSQCTGFFGIVYTLFKEPHLTVINQPFVKGLSVLFPPLLMFILFCFEDHSGFTSLPPLALTLFCFFIRNCFFSPPLGGHLWGAVCPFTALLPPLLVLSHCMSPLSPSSHVHFFLHSAATMFKFLFFLQKNGLLAGQFSVMKFGFSPALLLHTCGILLFLPISNCFLTAYIRSLLY